MLNPKAVAKLAQKKYRQQWGCFLVEGKKSIYDALEAQAGVKQLIISDQFSRQHSEYLHQPLLQPLMAQKQFIQVNSEVFSRIVDSTTPQGIAAVVEMPQTNLSQLLDTHLVVVLEDIRDPGNLGTIIRTADWFGVDGLLLIGGADPYQPKVVRSCMGSLFHLPLVTSQMPSQEIAQLKQQGFKIVVTRPELTQNPASNLPDLTTKIGLVFGNEAHGTSSQLDALADYTWTIPKFGSAESLNVAVSFGITMYEIRK